ncbi:hypothetical protein AVBRAN12642_07195 [Campylobacter sp. RM12642]|uniref:hypothetical protein n=1 Tax=unclassified Campylobacter TaxID=2593542 RepID=UPI001DDFFB21|nr:hypothetical protein [Campylobacter sp. RM12642]MBZ8008446.1 hypothetical protein [Campylobacter sp. RM9334]
MSEQVKTFIRVHYSLIDKYGLNDGVILSFLLSSNIRKGTYISKVLNITEPSICNKLKHYKSLGLIDDKNIPTQILKDEVKGSYHLMLFNELVKEHKILKAFIISYIISTVATKNLRHKAKLRSYQNIAKVSNTSLTQIKAKSKELIITQLLALVENKEPNIKQNKILGINLELAYKYNPNLKQGK